MAPSSTSDVPDENSVRLVVLAPQHSHKAKENNTKALVQANEILNNKGASPRYCKNMLLFLAPDSSKLELLEKNVCQYLAWNSIIQEKESLNLDVFQTNQATTKQQQSEKDVKNLIQETYIWLLVPIQPDPHKAIEWQEIRLQKHDSPVLQASRKAIHEEHLITNYAASRLRLEALDPYLWRDVNHLDTKKLWEYLANYLYLPRLRDEKVLLSAIELGVQELLLEDNFAYATGWDETKQRYLGLKRCEAINATLSSQNFIVKPEAAQRQFDEEEVVSKSLITINRVTDKSGVYKTSNVNNTKISSTNNPISPLSETITVPEPGNKAPTRFYGSVKLDALRLGRDVGEIADEVIQHFTSLVGAEVEITLELQVNAPDGVPENVIRTVTENCRVLKFTSQEFEQE